MQISVGIRDDILTNPQLPDTRIDIAIDERFESLISERWLQMVMEHALRIALPREQSAVQVSLMVTDDETVKALNAEYRGLNEITDVLSFSATHPGHWEGVAESPDGQGVGPKESSDDPFILPPGELPPLGEIVVSYPQTQKQAITANHPVERELALLIVHGVLHLMGHDHLEPDDQTLMQTQEGIALDAIFSPGAEMR